MQFAGRNDCGFAIAAVTKTQTGRGALQIVPDQQPEHAARNGVAAAIIDRTQAGCALHFIRCEECGKSSGARRARMKACLPEVNVGRITWQGRETLCIKRRFTFAVLAW